MPNCIINVTMFGGRRCGKTSVVTAMNRNFEDVFGGKSDLVISQSDYDTMKFIEEKEQDINGFFLNKQYGEFNTDGRPTPDGSEYLFDLQLRGRANQDRITLSLFDFPGEWLDDKDKNQVLAGKLKNCGVIMIAIDSPYLMEPLSDVLKSEHTVGRWNDQRNYCKRISSMVRNYFTPNWGLEQKMILFVPLKCEKYYACGQMGTLNLKIKEAYKDLLNYVNTGDARKHYEVVIAPILTFGKDTVLFSRFQEDEDGNLVMDACNRLPTVPLFKFQNREANYSPQFCEQPLLYALSYLIYQVEQAKKQEWAKRMWFGKFIQLMGEAFGNWASAKDFLEQRDKIQRHLKTSGDGYEILSDPLSLKGRVDARIQPNPFDLKGKAEAILNRGKK